MAINVVYSTLLLVSLPAVNLGLLSDYKICGDAECESPMTRVQAISDYYGRDCRFLSFRKGDTIFVYHKLTGKREDLWAGTIDKQFGYFSKDAVQVEDVHTTTEKVVATQDSDFFCMDEFGYIIDSNHLDGDDDVDEESPNQELETVLHADGSNNEGLSVPEATESPSAVHEAENILTEGIQHEAKTDAEAKEGSQEAPATPDVQGGSDSAPWLGSSVTGWFGLNSDEGEVEKKAEEKEKADESSLASSVTGWLGWGEGKEAEESVESKEQDLNTAKSFTSSMTGWLGFESKTEQPREKKQSEGDGVEEPEPAEKFRSRKMSLDLENSLSEEEDKREMGTLEWLGAGLTNQLSFGQTVQETEIPGGERKEEAEQASWFQVGIGNILGYEKEADVEVGSDVRDKNREESQLKETPEDYTVPLETNISEEVIANKDHGKEPAGDRTSDEEGDSKTQSPLEENASPSSGNSSVLTSLSSAVSEGKEEHNILDNDTIKLNLHDDVSLSEQNSEREEEEDIQLHTGETDQVYLTQSDVDLPSDLNNADLNRKFTEQLTNEGDKMEKVDEIQHQTDDISNEVSAVEGNGEKKEDFQIGNSTTLQQADELAEGSQVNDLVQETTEVFSEEQSSLAGQYGETGVDHIGSEAVTDPQANPEESDDEGKMVHVEESLQGSEESYSTAENTESENFLEPDEETSHTFKSTARHGHDDADISGKSVKPLSVQTETKEQETGGLQSSLGFDNETNGTMEHRQTVGVDVLDEPQVTEENEQKEMDRNLREEKTLDELKEDAAEGQEHSEITTEVAEETNIAKSQEEEREVVKMHTERKGETDAVEEKEEEKLGLKPNEEQGALEEMAKEEKQEEKKVVEEMLQQIHELKQEKEKKLEKLQKGDDTGTAKEEKDVQEPLKELKDVEDMGEKKLHTENLNKGTDEELMGEEASEESRDKGETRVTSVKTEEIKSVVESKKRDIQEEVTEATDVLSREEFREKENQQKLKKKENKQEPEEEENRQEFKVEENQSDLRHEENRQEFKEEENKQEFKEEENHQEFKEENKQEFIQEENKQEFKEEENKQEFKQEENKQEFSQEENKQEFKPEENQQEFKEEENHHEFKEEENQQEFKEEENQQEFKEEENHHEFKEVEDKQDFKEEEDMQEFKEEEDKQDFKQENKQEFKEEEDKQDFKEEEDMQEFKEEEDKQDFKEEEDKQESNEKDNRQSSKAGEEAAVPGDVEVQDGANGVQRQEQDIFEFASAQTGKVQSENQQRNIEEETENTNGDGVGFPQKEPADTTEVTSEEEDLTQGETFHSELSSLKGNEQNTIESAEQRVLTAEDQVSMVNAEESVGMDGGKDRKPSEEQTNDHLAGDGDVESSSIAGTNGEVLGSAENTDVSGFSGGVNTPPDDNDLQQEDKNHSDNTGSSTGEKTEQSYDDREIKESENNDTVFDSAPNGKSIDGTSSSGSFAEGQVVVQYHAGPQEPPGQGKGSAPTQTGKAFGLFNSAFNFFGEKESTSSLSDSDKSEESRAETSQTLDQEPELNDLPGVTGQGLIDEPQIHEPTIPEIAEIPQPATPSVSQPQQTSASASTGTPLQSKTLLKDYPTLVAHVGEADLALLVELFGRHKLQFLDYILGVSEPVAEERDHDESILTDIETLLDYHMGALAYPSARLAGSLQDQQKAGALQKLQDLLAKVRQSFNGGNSGDSDTKHQDKAEPGCVGKSCVSESKDEGIKTDAESGPAHLDISNPIEILRHVQDFAHRIANDLTVHAHAVGELLIWLSAQVGRSNISKLCSNI